MRTLLAKYATALLLFLPAAASSPLIRVDSRSVGRTFFVDPDTPEIRKALRDIGAPSPAGGVPEWLPAFPGAEIVKENAKELAWIEYRTYAEPDKVFAHYESALHAWGVRITYRNFSPGKGGSIHCEDSTRRASVSVTLGGGPTNVVVNWQAKTVHTPLAASARLEVVWFNDDTCVLCLRDAATGKQYDLDCAAMLNHSKSEVLQSSHRADFPPWLAEYPGAKIVTANGPPADWRPEKFIDMRTFNLEMETRDSVEKVAAFYRDTMKRNGLEIVRETQSESWAYSFEARNPDRTHDVLLDVLKRARDTHIRLSDTYTLPRR